MANTESESAEARLNPSSHPLVRGLLNLVVPLIAGEIGTTSLTAADSYNFEVFDDTGLLIQSFDLLERSRDFAMRFPSAAYLQGLNINRHDWLEYQISTFLITFVTIGDEALLLVNSVFCLGIDPKHCRPAILKKNKWVCETQIPKHLDAIERVIEPHRSLRNRFVHGGNVPSLNSMFKSNNLDQLRSMSFAVQHKPENFSDDFKKRLDEAYVKALSQIGKKLDDEVCQLKTVTWQLLTVLHNIHNQRLSALLRGVENNSP